MNKFVVALVFVALNFYTYYYFRSDEHIPPRETFDSFPLEFDEWGCDERIVMPDDILDNLGVTDYVLCTFSDESQGAWVHFYAGYHESQHRSKTGKTTVIHPPEHCLPGSGWDIIDSSTVPIDFGIPGEAKRFIIAKGNARNLVYFWYQSGGRVFASGFERILYLFMDRALRNRTDAALIRFTVPIVRGDETAAEAAFRDLAERIVPRLDQFIPN